MTSTPTWLEGRHLKALTNLSPSTCRRYVKAIWATQGPITGVFIQPRRGGLGIGVTSSKGAENLRKAILAHAAVVSAQAQASREAGLVKARAVKRTRPRGADAALQELKEITAELKLTRSALTKLIVTVGGTPTEFGL